MARKIFFILIMDIMISKPDKIYSVSINLILWSFLLSSPLHFLFL
jgi:hypothetical protein